MLTEQEIHALIEKAVEERTANPLPERPPRRIKLYNKKTGEKVETADGMVWPIDVGEWLATGEWVTARSEVVKDAPTAVQPVVKERKKPGPKPGSRRAPKAAVAGSRSWRTSTSQRPRSRMARVPGRC